MVAWCGLHGCPFGAASIGHQQSRESTHLARHVGRMICDLRNSLFKGPHSAGALDVR